MAEIEAVEVIAVEGHMLADNGTHALIGLVLPEGRKLALATTEERLSQIGVSIFAALAAFPDDGSSPKPYFDPARFEIGTGDGNISLSFRLPDGAIFRFALSPSMAGQIQETLAAALGSSPQKPENSSLQ